jgi:hypothetical protein
VSLVYVWACPIEKLGMQTELVSLINHTTLRWEDNIKMDIQEVGYEGMKWIHLAEDRDRCRTVVNAVINLRVPLGRIS